MKIIYQPSGKAREDSEWAANFYCGCSNDCEYCYCKKGLLSRLWSTSPSLKAGLKDEAHALDVFKKELSKNVDKIRKSSLLFSFTTDPLLPDTQKLTVDATCYALSQGVNVSILTKCADMQLLIEAVPEEKRKNVAIGFTLTNMDEMEQGAATNKERMKAMREMYKLGFRTFASIEPVIDPAKSISAITLTSDFCELYKIGLLSGKKNYTRQDIEEMYKFLHTFKDCNFYLKDSFLSFIDMERDKINSKLFVNNDYNLFNQPTCKEAILLNPFLISYYSILLINDIACAMSVDAFTYIKLDKKLYRHMIKKILKAAEEEKDKYEKMIKKKIRLESYFFDDACQNMRDEIEPEVKQLFQIVLEKLDGNLNNPKLFAKMEMALLFTGIACVSYENILKDLKKKGGELLPAFKLKPLLDLIDKLFNVLQEQYKVDSLIELNTPETDKIIGKIYLKIKDPYIIQNCVHNSEMENLTQIE